MQGSRDLSPPFVDIFGSNQFGVVNILTKFTQMSPSEIFLLRSAMGHNLFRRAFYKFSYFNEATPYTDIA